MTDRHYTRWTRTAGEALRADILASKFEVFANPHTGLVQLNGQSMTPDEARLIGVRLIDAAVLADGPRAIREHRAPFGESGK